MRDQLLGYPVKERDWVVVGATPTQMLQLGYRQVGRDFPVFLHPETHEEYALARIERKIAPGYDGFACDVNPAVTLEEDLRRRDLTINAMAMDSNGRIIDPYHGQDDLSAKVLRHVSPAFVEDPVRVLRVARFMARYHHLGFTLAEDTRALMYAMVRRGELQHLVAERVWQEWQRSLSEKNPELFIDVLRACGALRVVLPELDALFGVPNTPHYHPEVDSGVHTLMVLCVAASLSSDPLVRFAALMHDLGKARTPMAAWPAHHGHEMEGMVLIEGLCHRLRIPADYRTFAVMVARFHLTIHRLFELRANTIVDLFEQTDAFRRQQRFDNLLLVCEADARGLKQPRDYPQRSQWTLLRNACANMNGRALMIEGHAGLEIKMLLHERRVACVKHLMNVWNEHEK